MRICEVQGEGEVRPQAPSSGVPVLCQKWWRCALVAGTIALGTWGGTQMRADKQAEITALTNTLAARDTTIAQLTLDLQQAQVYMYIYTRARDLSPTHTHTAKTRR